MDIFNKIWSYLSTPNELLVNISFVFLIILIEAPLTYSLISNFFNIKFSKKQKYIYILLICIIAIISVSMKH